LIYQSFTGSAGSNYTMQGLFKKQTSDKWLELRMSNSSNSHQGRTWFDLENGVLGTTGTIGSLVTPVSQSITQLGTTGWYFATSTFSTATVTTMRAYFNINSADGGTSRTDTSQTMLMWQANVWDTLYSHSPLNSVASSLSATTDVLTLDASTIPLNDCQVYCEFTPDSLIASDQTILQFVNGTDILYLHHESADDQYHLDADKNGAAYSIDSTVTAVPGTKAKILITFSSTAGTTLNINGTEVTDATASGMAAFGAAFSTARVGSTPSLLPAFGKIAYLRWNAGTDGTIADFEG